MSERCTQYANTNTAVSDITQMSMSQKVNRCQTTLPNVIIYQSTSNSPQSLTNHTAHTPPTSFQGYKSSSIRNPNEERPTQHQKKKTRYNAHSSVLKKQFAMTIERVKRDSERDQSEKKRDGKQVVERKRGDGGR